MPAPFNGMSLFSEVGERKYLSGPERLRYYEALSVLNDDPKGRTFCEMIYWTGCRPSEALGMSAIQIDLSEFLVVIRSLKKHGNKKDRHFRQVPLPDHFVERIDRVHGVAEAQAQQNRGSDIPLWNFSRTTGWRRNKTVMEAAKLNGLKACGRGLRHTLGVHAAVNKVPESKIQRYLGHESAESTAIYLDVVGPEDRALAKRMW